VGRELRHLAGSPAGGGESASDILYLERVPYDETTSGLTSRYNAIEKVELQIKLLIGDKELPGIHVWIAGMNQIISHKAKLSLNSSQLT